VVFSGQLLAQMIMVSDAAAGGKEAKSIHAIFARAGSYRAGPIEFLRDPMHSGRAWASDTITVVQGDRLLARGLVLLNAVEPDLMRHTPAMPDVPGPDDCSPRQVRVVYPGVEVRMVDLDDRGCRPGSPVTYLWIRSARSYRSAAANQAIVVWSQPGLAIGTAMRAHPATVDPSEAHRSISTGVISHTAHFHERAELTDWLLFVHEAPYAGHGRVFGSGAVFGRDGRLVSTFTQDSMARVADRPIEWERGM
jgi:acyl-CoA thioesterase II